MDTILTAKMVGFAGLCFDVIGACCLYDYAFKLPHKLKEQESLLGSMKEEVIDGRKNTTITTGVVVDLRAVCINQFNEYRAVLYGRRIVLGFWSLIAGLFLQALSNFIGYFVSADTGWTLAAIFVAVIIVAWVYLFCYLKDMPELEEGIGQEFRYKVANDGFTIESDERFRSWSKKLSSARNKAGLP